jgi:hypothetical protein
MKEANTMTRKDGRPAMRTVVGRGAATQLAALEWVSFWHPYLSTLRVGLWYPIPDGLYHGTNPLVRPYT